MSVMTIYQLFINGYSAVFDGAFRKHSKIVYMKEPSKEDIDKFVKACTDNSYFDYLDESQPYTVNYFTLELVDNR